MCCPANTPIHAGQAPAPEGPSKLRRRFTPISRVLNQDAPESRPGLQVGVGQPNGLLGQYPNSCWAGCQRRKVPRNFGDAPHRPVAFRIGTLQRPTAESRPVLAVAVGIDLHLGLWQRQDPARWPNGATECVAGQYPKLCWAGCQRRKVRRNLDTLRTDQTRSGLSTPGDRIPLRPQGTGEPFGVLQRTSAPLVGMVLRRRRKLRGVYRPLACGHWASERFLELSKSGMTCRA